MPTFLTLACAASCVVQDAAPERYALALADDAAIELEAFWEPFARWSLGTADVVEHPLLNDVEPLEESRRVPAAVLRPFLPADPVAVGDAWAVEPSAVVPLLAQLHAGATQEMSNPGQSVPGSAAVLRAASPRYVEVLTRSHATFEVSDDLRINPAQFEGRLLIERTTGAVVAYRLRLPPRDTNADVNVRVAPPSAELPFGMTRIDIGFIPRMELVGGAWPESVEWTAELDDRAARRVLRDRFYAPIGWLPFEEAVAHARATNKPLHVVTVFGAFDDESC